MPLHFSYTGNLEDDGIMYNTVHHRFVFGTQISQIFTDKTSWNLCHLWHLCPKMSCTVTGYRHNKDLS